MGGGREEGEQRRGGRTEASGGRAPAALLPARCFLRRLGGVARPAYAACRRRSLADLAAVPP